MEGSSARKNLNTGDLVVGALQYLVKPFTHAGLRTEPEACATLRHTLERGGAAEQGEVDRLFGALWAAGEPDLPKGPTQTTAELVGRALRSAGGPLSAQEIAESAGMSRQTTQHCPKLLERTGRVPLTLRYGGKGRPEHRCTWSTGGQA